jgi:hypothetical protein
MAEDDGSAGSTGVITEARARSLANLRPPWKPGETGNAVGRPRRVDAVEAAIAEAAPPEKIGRLLRALYRRGVKGNTRAAALFLKHGTRGLDESAIGREVERQLALLMAEAQRIRAEQQRSADDAVQA